MVKTLGKSLKDHQCSYVLYFEKLVIENDRGSFNKPLHIGHSFSRDHLFGPTSGQWEISSVRQPFYYNIKGCSEDIELSCLLLLMKVRNK